MASRHIYCLSVSRVHTLVLMLEFGIPKHLVDLVIELFTQVECQVKIGNRLSPPFHVMKDLRQGDPLSCLLFNISLAKVFRDTKLNTRNTIINITLQILDYTEDIVLIARI